MPLALALAAFLLAALAAPAETFLVAVTETDDGEPSRPPLTAREGIFAALFDGEHIAFEVPDDGSRQPTGALRLLAAEAGAGTLAVITVDWHQERLTGGAFRVWGRGSIVLVDALSGREAPVLPLAVGNDGPRGRRRPSPARRGDRARADRGLPRVVGRPLRTGENGREMPRFFR